MKSGTDLTDIACKVRRDTYLPFAAFKKSLKSRYGAFKSKFRDRQVNIKKRQIS